MPNLIKTLPVSGGRALSNRYQIRKFKHACDMYTFLARSDNSLFWRELKSHDLKSGIYFSQTDSKGTRYLPESMLR